MNAKEKKFKGVLNAQIGKGNIKNVVAAVQSFDRSLDFIGAAGIANHQTGTVMVPETPYFIASVTKMYTVAIALRLHEEKSIDLNAPISEYLPDSLTNRIHIYKGIDLSNKIKVTNLMDQSSGLADYESDKPRGGKSLLDELKKGNDRTIDTHEAIKIVRNLTPHFAPGTQGKAYYSNTNYRLLGAIIESVTKKIMAVNFNEMIFTPLGLQQTYLFDALSPRSSEDPATVYLKDLPIIVPKYLSSNVSDGGIVSTASENLIFLRAFFEGQLFNKALFERMTNWKSIFFPLRYGYGLMRFKLPRFFWISPLPEFVGHSGSTGSFAFSCPSRSLYLAGTINQMASPSKPFFLMMDLVRSVS